MSYEEKLAIIKSNTEEIVSEGELIKILKTKKSPVAYCGYEPNGPMHLGHFVTVTKLMDLQKAGFKIKILLADLHAMLNRKGNEKEISKEVSNWVKTLKAIGIKAEIVLGSSFQFKKEYQLDVMALAQNSTINRGLRAMQEIARDFENATISQLWYPLMQAADIKHLKIDVAVGGMEQRKVHMIGKDSSKILNHEFIAIHTPLITSLKDPGNKMSKSIPGSSISITNTYEEIKSTLKNAYCPEKVIVNNPVLQIAKLIIFPMLKKISIKRPEKFGGNLEIDSYSSLEQIYSSGKLHPLDLKTTITEELEKIIAPMRKNYK